MLIALYPSKKELKANIGQPLKYVETSMFGPEYKADGEFSVCNRPSLPEGFKGPGVREFFARVTMAGGIIASVE